MADTATYAGAMKTKVVDGRRHARAAKRAMRRGTKSDLHPPLDRLPQLQPYRRP